MRLTVGPMPPSVYWRRRALVAGIVLVVILIVAYSCSGGDDPSKKPAANPSATTGSQPAADQPAAGPSVITPNPSEPSSGNPPNTGNGNTGVTGEGATGETCTDGELSVTSSAENTSVRQGVPTTFFIRIKNISTRLCSRDLSAQAQELYLEQSSAKQWSSDACGNTTGAADVRRLQPNIEHVYSKVWNGQGTAQGCNAQSLLKQGTYQLRARLGNKISDPVTVTVTG